MTEQIPAPTTDEAIPADQRKALGAKGEDMVLNAFICAGYQIVHRNWRAGRYAEIDLIATDRDGTIVFIEVKTRFANEREYGFIDDGFNAIHWRKRRKILIASQIYMARSQQQFPGARFDVVVVEVRRNPLRMKLIHVPDAFNSY